MIFNPVRSGGGKPAQKDVRVYSNSDVFSVAYMLEGTVNVIRLSNTRTIRADAGSMLVILSDKSDSASNCKDFGQGVYQVYA